jgi:hypothetical protein
VFNENKEYLEECYARFIHICDRKGVRPDIEFKSVEEGKKKGFFIDSKETVEASQNEISIQRRIFSELKWVKDSIKKAVID